jgi:hypothetical protein
MIQVFETAYMLKYVEKHDRMDRDIPWSVRQMAVYQRFETSTKQSSCILIQASAKAEKRLAEVTGDDALKSHWAALHQCVLGTLSYGWAQYLRFLDIKISEAVCTTSQVFDPGYPDRSCSALRSAIQKLALQLQSAYRLRSSNN